MASSNTRSGSQCWVVVGLFIAALFVSSQLAAKTIPEKLQVDRGICVVIGDPDGAALATELAGQTELTIYLQVASDEEASATRRAAHDAGLYGTRLYVERGDLPRIHLADNLADAVVVGPSISDVSDALNTELLRVLRPQGQAIIGEQTITKPPLANTGDWRHPYHGPDNNPQSSDQVARGPYLTHFMAKPWYATMPQMTVISGGRIIKVFGNRASARPQWPVLNTMLCMNAYNGTVLWRRKLNPDFMLHRNTLVATPETIYFADDTSCKFIEPASGQLRHELVVPSDLADGPVWKWMALDDGVLYALVGEKEPPASPNRGGRYRGAGWPWWKIQDYRFGFGRTILAFDVTQSTPQVLWHYRSDEPLDSRAMCMSADRIFVHSDQSFLGCLEKKTGKVVWQTADEELLAAIGEHDPAQHWLKGFASTSYAKCNDKAVFFAGPTQKNLVAVSATDGQLLWKRAGGNTQLVLREDGLYALGEGSRNSASSSLKLDPLGGQVLATFPSRDRCTRATGNIDSIFTRGGAGGSTSVFSVTSDQPSMTLISPMRPACQDGVLVAHGHLYWGPWKCRCDATQIGVIALGPGGDFDYAAKAVERDRLQRGANLPADVAAAVDDSDWPTYRKDNARGTRTDLAIPKAVRAKWTFTPRSPNVATAPVAVGSLVFVAGSEGVVRALGATDGKPRWTAYTGGAVNYPPSVDSGAVYVGSGDGWIYCFAADRGGLLWRFRAAPLERKIPVYDRLLSTWPVGSGTLVEDGTVYAAAGMSNYDGTHVLALDAKSGSVVWQNNTAGHLYPEVAESGAGVQSHLLLHDDAIYMSGGAQAPIVSFDIADGRCRRRGAGRGKDLFVVDDQVTAAGNPLYWRQEDSHHIVAATLSSAAGPIRVETAKLALLKETAEPKNAKGRQPSVWTAQPFHENCAVAVADNAILVAGVNRQITDEEVKTTSGICAVNLNDGSVIWKHPLPASPVAWGIAVNREGSIVVSLQTGQVVCFVAKD